MGIVDSPLQPGKGGAGFLPPKVGVKPKPKTVPPSSTGGGSKKRSGGGGGSSNKTSWKKFEQTVGISPSKPPEEPQQDTMTAKEYRTFRLQQRAYHSGQAWRTKLQLQQSIKSLKPGEQYRFEHEPDRTYDYHRTKSILESELSNVERSEQDARGIDVRSPVGYDVVRSTDEGYVFEKSDKQIQKERYAFMNLQFAKMDKAPPVVREIAQFGYGSLSSMGATIQPVISVFTGKPVYHPSMFDIAFEPEGAKIWGKHPAFTAGSVFGETLQIYAGSQLFKAGGTVARTGFKGIVKRVPSVYSKFTRVFPEEKFITSAARKVGTTQVGSRVYKWSSKGYKFGKTLVQKTTKPQTVVKPLGVEVTSKKFVLKSSGRVFMSPSQQQFAAKELSRKLAEGYSWKGIFNKRLFKKSVVTNVYDTSVKQWGMKPLESSGKTFGSLYNIGDTSLDVLESQAKGMRVYSKTGEFLGYKKVDPRMFQPLQPKKWISKYRKPFLQSITGYQSLAPQVQVPKGVFKKPTSHILMQRMGLGISVIAPPVNTSAFLPLVYGSISSGYRIKYKPEVKSVSVSNSDYTTSPVSMVASVQKTATVQIPKPVQIQTPGFDTVQSTMPKLDMGTMLTQQSASVSVPMVSHKTVVTTTGGTMPLPFLFPKGSLYGRGTYYPGETGYYKKYRFQKFNVKPLLKGIKV